MARNRLIIRLSSFERQELEQIIEHNDCLMVSRCKIILMTEQGVPLQDIADRVGVSKTTANTWRQIFKKKRMPGLKIRKRLGRPPNAKKISLSKTLSVRESRDVLLAADSCTQ